MNRAVFLDRDGVITQEPPHYAHKISQLALINGAADGIRRLNENGYMVVVVSNQSGIGRGYYGVEAAERYNEALIQKLSEAGARLDAVYYCPHYPEATVEKYRVDCDCRKPKPGMLKTAEKALELDLAQSYMVGDKSIDIEAGKRAGCRTILVKTGYGSEELKRNHVDCDYIAEDLDDAARHITYRPDNKGEGE